MSDPPLTLSPSAKGDQVLQRVKDFIKNEIEPNLHVYDEQFKAASTRWCVVPVLEEWKVGHCPAIELLSFR